MKYNFEVGDNITITDDFNYWLEEIQKENESNNKKIKLIKESLSFYKEYNVAKEDFINNLEKIINGD